MTNTIVCLMGPTASGKTQLAIDLVEKYPFEIISVDSAMVYRHMDIGTAKPDAETLKKAPHRLIDIRDPAQAYSAAQFREDALNEIANIVQQNKIPLLVGGTMLYFSALQKGLSDLPSADELIRAKLTEQAAKSSWAEMHAYLSQVDPSAGARIHPNDAQRIQRALEVYELTGKNLTQWQQESTNALVDYQVINIVVSPLDRAVLHDRIALRFEQMLEQGFVEEVQQLLARGDLSLETPAIRSVGYRQVWQYLIGELSSADMQEKGVIATRQLAKRQLTWLRHWHQHVEWFDSLDPALLQQVLAYLMPYIAK